MRYHLCIVFLLILSFPAQAADHAIAMHGTPLYPAEYQYFDYVNPDAPKGGVFRQAKTGTFNNLNPLIINGDKVEGLELLTDQLMQRAWNEPFTLYGLVAESIDVAEDRSWIQFNLNKNARFHDGAPMTTADVKFSFDMYRTHGHPVRRRVYGLVDKVNIIDLHKIKFTFGEGYDRESVMILALMHVLPKHYWETRDISKTTLEPPLGSGPYKIADVDAGRKITYERVKDYWAKDVPAQRGHFNFDKISYTYFRDDGVALESFKAGEYDLRREYDIKKWNTAYDFPALEEGKVIKEEITHHRPEWLKAFIFNTRKPLFQDRRVRKALGLMFNYEWLNKNLYYSSFKAIKSVFPNSELAATGAPQGAELEALKKYKDNLPSEVFGPSWKASTKTMRQNQRQAMRLLKEAGWIYQDGILTHKNGQSFEFEILLENPNDEKMALEYIRNLQKLGIIATVRTVDKAQFTGRLQDFDFDMVSFRWINSLSPGAEQLNYWGAAAADNPGSRNYPGIKNPAIDFLAASIAQAKTREDLVARTRALDQAIMWGHYFIPLFYSGKDRLSYAANIKRLEKTPVYGVVLETFWTESLQ